MKRFLTLTSLKYLGRKKKSKLIEENTEKESTKEKNETDSTEEKIQRELRKPLWLETNKKEFEALTRDIDSNQDNNDFEIIINERTHDLKNVKKSWMEVTTRKTTKSEAKILYNKLIQKETDALEREKSDEIEKYNIFDILCNVG